MKAKPIQMPALTDTMQTGHLLSWKKQLGDPVKKGDVLAEIESDKALMDLEAFNDGFLAGPLATADTDIPVGTVIAYLVDSKDKAGQTISNKEPDQAGSQVAPTPLADAPETAAKTKQDKKQVESPLPFVISSPPIYPVKAKAMRDQKFHPMPGE